MGRRGRQRDTAGGNRKTQGLAYLLAMGWLGVWRRRGTDRRSGGERKRTAGLSGGWFLWGGTGGTHGRFITEIALQIFSRIYQGSDSKLTRSNLALKSFLETLDKLHGLECIIASTQIRY